MPNSAQIWQLNTKQMVICLDGITRSGDLAVSPVFRKDIRPQAGAKSPQYAVRELEMLVEWSTSKVEVEWLSCGEKVTASKPNKRRKNFHFKCTLIVRCLNGITRTGEYRTTSIPLNHPSISMQRNNRRSESEGKPIF